jgi:hypothetical protein
VSGQTAPLVIEIPTEDQMHELGLRLGSLLIAGDLLPSMARSGQERPL